MDFALSPLALFHQAGPVGKTVMLALIALSVPIVRVLFQRGAFGGIDTLETANTLIWFSAGLPAYVLIRVLQPA